MSGTIVGRRDQVFTTFFSFRVFSPSTFSRRWPSTNGPFFSERPIDSLFLHSPQPAPLRPPHLLKTTHRARNAMRLRTERADKARALRVRNSFHNDGPTRFAQLVEHWFRRRHYNLYGRFKFALGHHALGDRSFCWPVGSPPC